MATLTGAEARLARQRVRRAAREKLAAAAKDRARESSEKLRAALRDTVTPDPATMIEPSGPGPVDLQANYPDVILPPLPAWLPGAVAAAAAMPESRLLERPNAERRYLGALRALAEGLPLAAIDATLALAVSMKWTTDRRRHPGLVRDWGESEFEFAARLQRYAGRGIGPPARWIEARDWITAALHRIEAA